MKKISFHHHPAIDLCQDNPIVASSAYGIILSDGTFLAPNGKVFDKKEMDDIVKKYRHVNRIHKSYSLLFYIDNKKNIK